MNEQLKKWINEFNELHPERELLFVWTAGSHFFGLNTANSDVDFRGVYSLSPEETVKRYKSSRKKHRVDHYERYTNKNGKNSGDDVDLSMVSLHKFLELLSRGDFNMMEALYCEPHKILIDSPIAKELRGRRESLLINDITSFLGFIKKEYNRYGVGIKNYSNQLKFMEFLKEKQESHHHPRPRLEDIWDEIVEYSQNEQMMQITDSMTGLGYYVPTVKIAHRLYQSTVKVQYVIDAIEKRLKRYGHRQKNMAQSGKEFKGLYHALRLIYEAQDMCKEGKLNLPLSKERLDTLLQIKKGEMPAEQVHKLVDNGIEELEVLESQVIPNKRQIRRKFEQMLFNLNAREELKNVITGGSSGN